MQRPLLLSRSSPRRGDRTAYTVYLSEQEARFVSVLPGVTSWTDAISQVVRDQLFFFGLPAHVQARLRRDMQTLQCASPRDYLIHLLTAQYARLTGSTPVPPPRGLSPRARVKGRAS